jgi:hypothetical protein
MVGGGLSTGQIVGGFGLKYLPRMKIQMIVAAVLLMSFVTAIAATNEYRRAMTLVFIFLGTTAAGE